jgi:signal transduction histidine kinase
MWSLLCDDLPAMASTTVTVAPRRDAVRDPVLLLPAAVAAGLGIGWLGVHEHVSGTRIAADLTLAWSLVAAALVALERPRWRVTTWLLAAAAFALLGADLAWTSTRVVGTIGVLLGWLWAAILVQLVLTFPEGRAWTAPARIVVPAAYAAAIGGQVVVAFASSNEHAAHRAQQIVALAVGAAVLGLVARHLLTLQGPGRRAQAPLFFAAVASAATSVGFLGWLLAADTSSSTLNTIARLVAISLPIGVVAGIGWSRLHRPQATELAVELSTDAGDMRARLARTLGDPTLELAYRLDDGRYVDAAGHAIELPRQSDRAVTALTSGGEEIALLVHDPALLDEPGLVESVRATAGLVLENERLAAQVRSQLAEVRASRGRIVAAADAERRRIERNLHDGAQQRLVTLSMALGLEAARAGESAADALSRAQDEIEQAISELRELARGIHPTLLRDEGLEAAVVSLARRTPLPVTVHGSVSTRVPDTIELAAYFVVAEALTNVVKHASATEASVALDRDGGTLGVTVRDSGVGGARIAPESGLAGLRDRLDALDATLTIDSPVGAGTTVRADFPCAS